MIKQTVGQAIEYGYFKLFMDWCNAVMTLTNSYTDSVAFFAADHDKIIDNYLVFFANHDGSAYVAPSYF